MTACASANGIKKKENSKPQTLGLSSSVQLILILIHCNGMGQMTNIAKLPANALCIKGICQFMERYETPAYVSIKPICYAKN